MIQPHQFQYPFTVVFMIPYVLQNLTLYPATLPFYVICMGDIRRLIPFRIIDSFLVITVFAYVLVCFTTIRFDMWPRRNVLLNYCKQCTLFSVLHDHRGPIIIFINSYGKLQTVTKWMAAMILMLHKFWFGNMDLYASSYNDLLLMVNIINDKLSKPKLVSHYFLWWVGE